LEAGAEPRRRSLWELRALDPALRRRLLVALERELVHALRRRVALLEHSGPLAPATVGRLEKSFAKRLGHPVHFTVREDPSLIGGLRVTCGDRRWEYSLRSTLDQFLAGSGKSAGPVGAQGQDP
jgi:F0F1-type ATP synthase delta subunit